MATIYLDIPDYTPDYIIVYQAATAGGTQAEVVNDAYGAFPQSGGQIIIDSVDILASKYSFVTFLSAGEESAPLIIAPAGSPIISLQTLFDNVLPRLRFEPPQRDFLATVAHVVDYIDRRLFELESDLILVDNEYSLAISEFQVALPFGMLGLDEDPSISYTDCTKKVLTRLPEDKRHRYTEPGIPEHYEVRGASMNIYPTPDRAVTLRFATYNKSVVDEMTDSVPYEGLFNELLTELVIKFGSNPMLASVDPMVESVVDRWVDRVLRNRVPKNVRFLHMSNYR